jgi:hypothetical protein
VDGVTLNMELDTGSAVSVIAKDDYIKKFPNLERLTKTKFPVAISVFPVLVQVLPYQFVRSFFLLD